MRYILQHPRAVISANIGEAAQRAFSSPSTIGQVCKKLGLPFVNHSMVGFNDHLYSQRKARKHAALITVCILGLKSSLSRRKL